MADVSKHRRRRYDGERRGGEAGADRRDRDRGQLLLVGALALAVLFVALALLLNTAIYTGNLAARDAGDDATPAIEYVSAARSAGADAVYSVNRRNNTNATELNRAFTATMSRWDDLATHHRAVAGVITGVDVTGTTNGTQIQQDNASRRFTNDTGAADWTVIDDSGITSVRSMRFTVDNSTLTPIDDAGNATTEPVFRVDITSGADTRSAYIYYNATGDNPEVLVDDTNETVCAAESVTGGTFVVDVPNESVGGARCQALGGIDDDPDAIEYGNGDAARGTYTMVADEPPSSLSLSDLNASGTGSPYWTDAIYGANLSVTYRTADLDYEATIEVMPK